MIIPEDIKAGLAKFKEPAKAVKELKEIIKTNDTIKAMPPEQEEFKIRYAWALLCGREGKKLIGYVVFEENVDKYKNIIYSEQIYTKEDINITVNGHGCMPKVVGIIPYTPEE